MVSQPQLQQGQEDLLSWNVRVVERVSLLLPLPAELFHQFTLEEGELQKFLFGLWGGEKVEVGVIVDHIFFGVSW